GFRVIGEVGKKNPADPCPIEAQIEQALADLAAGASMVIVEGRESGRGVGIFGTDGEIVAERLAALAGRLPLERIIWEAPLKNQQEELILAYGPNVNLGNIPPGDVLALEALRVGLRGDTLRAALRRNEGTAMDAAG
ncbi:MAG: phosphosulfolactate synthase, partial [Bacteroidota bacterium]